MRNTPSMLAVALTMLLAAATTAGAANTKIGKQIADFTIPDCYGKSASLSDFKDRKLVVVAFLGTDCPLVRLYGPRLDQLAKKYADSGVALIGINSNRQDQPRKIAAHARQHGMTFPILKDLDNRVADMFDAQRTPEIFVLDETRTVRYSGRVDDQYGFSTGTGYGRPNLSRSDLSEAIEELLAGKVVSVPTTEVPGCIIGRNSKVEPHGDVTYSNQIARIFQKHCVECHRQGEIGPFAMTSYEEVAGWGEMIKEVVEQKRMPPWYANPDHGKFRNERRVTAEEKDLIARWVAAGQPEGNPADLPKPRVFADGWQIPEPDVVVYMNDEPFKVPAEGTVEYIHYTVDPGFKEDKWVKAVEARPDNRGVVHHIVVTVLEPGENNDAAFARRGSLVGYAPGMQPRVYPDGVGTFIPAGSKLVFQMHYTPNGVATEDRSKVGIVFADPEKIKYVARGGVCGTASFKIPAGAADHVINARQELPRDILLTGMMPHTHVRGTSFRYEVDYPDGSHEVLLDVPNFDFNWQLWYDLVEPKRIPKGSIIRTTAHYDNSPENVYNPDPTIEVTYGDQTWEEMMFGWYATVIPRDAQDTDGTYSVD